MRPHRAASAARTSSRSTTTDDTRRAVGDIGDRGHGERGGYGAEVTETSPEPPVFYRLDAGVAHLELNRPDAFNALSVELAEALAEAVGRAAADDEVKVLLLSGRGRAFCGGGDVKQMAAVEDTSAMVHELAQAAHRGVLALAELDKPVIGAVHGSVAGGGLGLTCSVDLLLAGESTKFVAAYGGIAVTPDCSVTWGLPRIIGERRALQLLLRNQVVTAHTAEEWGLVTEVVPDAEILESGRALAASIAADPAAAALGRTRRLVREAGGRSLPDQLDAEAAAIAHFAGRPEAASLIQRFAAR